MYVIGGHLPHIVFRQKYIAMGGRDGLQKPPAYGKYKLQMHYQGIRHMAGLILVALFLSRVRSKRAEDKVRRLLEEKCNTQTSIINGVLTIQNILKDTDRYWGLTASYSPLAGKALRLLQQSDLGVISPTLPALSSFRHNSISQ